MILHHLFSAVQGLEVKFFHGPMFHDQQYQDSQN